MNWGKAPGWGRNSYPKEWSQSSRKVRFAPPSAMAARKRALAVASGRVSRNLKSAKTGSPNAAGRSAKLAVVFRARPGALAFAFIRGRRTGPIAAELGILRSGVRRGGVFNFG